MFGWLRRLFTLEPDEPPVSMCLYCPGCRENLVTNLADWQMAGNYVSYRCPCGIDSTWDFGASEPSLLSWYPTNTVTLP